MKGWRETSGAKLWRISMRPDLIPDLANFFPRNENNKADSQEKNATLEAFSAYEFAIRRRLGNLLLCRRWVPCMIYIDQGNQGQQL